MTNLLSDLGPSNSVWLLTKHQNKLPKRFNHPTIHPTIGRYFLGHRYAEAVYLDSSSVTYSYQRSPRGLMGNVHPAARRKRTRNLCDTRSQRQTHARTQYPTPCYRRWSTNEQGGIERSCDARTEAHDTECKADLHGHNVMSENVTRAILKRRRTVARFVNSRLNEFLYPIS